MTYQVGGTIQASDYNTFRGTNDTNVPYVSDDQATNAVAALLGVGYGSRGYGYTALSLPEITIGQLIGIGAWNVLGQALSLIANHTGIASPNVLISIPGTYVEPPVVTSGSLIQALDGSNSRANLALLISTQDTNRFYANVYNMALTNVLNSVRTSSWNYSNNVYHEFTVNFNSEDQARHFFNTGGSIYVSANRTGGASHSMNAAVTQMLSEMGTIIFSANGVSYTGINGNITSLGYYQLSQTFTQVFSHYGDQSSDYANISYILAARIENYTGINGGNGSLIRFQAIFRLDGYSSGTFTYEKEMHGTTYTDYGYDVPTASGTLSSAVACYRANSTISVPQPNFITTVSVGP